MFGFRFELYVHALWRMLHTRVRMIELCLFACVFVLFVLF
jgi:hypothetical protein